MGYTHSHRRWVGIAAVRGVEAPQRRTRSATTMAGPGCAWRMSALFIRGDVATLVPPGDVHNYGHVVGSGPCPYSLILLGDDMLLFGREEYDAEHWTWRVLAPVIRAGIPADLRQTGRLPRCA